MNFLENAQDALKSAVSANIERVTLCVNIGGVAGPGSEWTWIPRSKR